MKPEVAGRACRQEDLSNTTGEVDSVAVSRQAMKAEVSRSLLLQVIQQ